MRVGLFICAMIAVVLVPFWAKAESYTVYLQDNKDQKIAIAALEIQPAGQYSLTFKEDLFQDYFLSMRPFRCMTADRLVCRQPYPYALDRVLKGDDLRPLEYDLIFITKQEGEYGIDPYNGRYYLLQKTGTGFEGVVQGIDLNVLAAPPENGEPFPITPDDLDEMEASSTAFPKIVIE